MEIAKIFLEGFINSFIIIAASCVLPLCFGIGLSFVARINKTVNKVLSWVSLPVECLCPLVLLMVMYFVLLPSVRFSMLIAIITFSIAFIAYMPARYVSEWSVAKNLLHNGLGLIAAITKWSFVVGYFGIGDLLQAAMRIRSHTFSNVYLLIPFVASVLMLALPEIGKRCVKTFMK